MLLFSNFNFKLLSPSRILSYLFLWIGGFSRLDETFSRFYLGVSLASEDYKSFWLIKNGFFL